MAGRTNELDGWRTILVFLKKQKRKITSLALQRHHVAVWCKLSTRTKHVILMLFLCSNHIINKVIKYCCPPLPVCPILDRCVTRCKGSSKVHVTVIAGRRVKRTSSRPAHNARDALTIYWGNAAVGRDSYWRRPINNPGGCVDLLACRSRNSAGADEIKMAERRLAASLSRSWRRSCRFSERRRC